MAPQHVVLNLETELPDWDFDRVRRESREVWNDWLSKIDVEGGTEKQRTKFYTDLWHTRIASRARAKQELGKPADRCSAIDVSGEGTVGVTLGSTASSHQRGLSPDNTRLLETDCRHA